MGNPTFKEAYKSAQQAMRDLEIKCDNLGKTLIASHKSVVAAEKSGGDVNLLREARKEARNALIDARNAIVFGRKVLEELSGSPLLR